MNVIGIIPARGGSKGIPLKNIRPLAQKSLIGWTIEHALESQSLDRVIVSTDDPEIARIAVEFGAEVPFLRPANLANDSSATLPVIVHAADQLKSQGHDYDVFVILQATSPFRGRGRIDQAVDCVIAASADVVVCLSPVHQHPFWMKVVDHSYVVPFISTGIDVHRRQDLPDVYAINGSIYVITNSALQRRRSLAASFATQLPGEKVSKIILDQRESLEIDTPFDFDLAEALFTIGASYT